MELENSMTTASVNSHTRVFTTQNTIVRTVTEAVTSVPPIPFVTEVKPEKKVKAPKDYSYRTFTIKKKNGKTRRICAPSADLLRFQRRALPQLVKEFHEVESKLFNYEVFHGFIPHRNIVTCAELHKGFSHTITLDISNCFDSITIEMLQEIAGLNLNPKFFESGGSLAQGFATSPILSAIYLCYPLVQIAAIVKHIDKNAVVTCYADDIQISLTSTEYDVMNRVITYATHIMKKFNLEVNTKKTRIRHSKYGNRKVLGIQVGKDTLSPSRKLKKKIRAASFQKNGPSLGGLITASRMMLPKSRRSN